MKKFVCLVLCGILLISVFPVNVQATETAEDEVSLEEFTSQLSDMVEKYDNNSLTEEYEEYSVNSVTEFSVTESDDTSEETPEYSNGSTDRLIVKAEGDIDTLDAVAYIEGYNDLHILQFDNSTSAEEALEYYENCDDVIYAQEDGVNRITDFEITETSSEVTLPQPMIYDANILGFTALRQKLADSNTTYSQQLTVAVIDTGIAYDHDLLKDRVDPNGYDAVNNSSAYDDHGHGTHVAGIIVANTLENVTIKPYKVLNYEGKGTDAQTVLGVEAAIADGVDVINMSFGRQGENPAMDEALEKAHKAGIILVASAGNDGVNMDVTPYTPACCDNVITVMAYNAYMNKRMDFSNYGSMCETAAIGENVTSSYLNNQYAYTSGTSQAAPYVAAAVTYLVLNNPSVTYAEIVERIDQREVLKGMYVAYMLDENLPKIPAPTFSAESCTFEEEFQLEIYCSEPDTYINYNLSTWSSPTLYQQYEEPITIKYDTVVTAYVEKKGCITSDKSTVTFTRNFLNEEDKYIISSAGEITKYLGGDMEDNTEIIIPNTINGIIPTKIGERVFENFGYLKNVVLPDSITAIGNYAFKYCTDLERITARNVTKLGNAVFYHCTNLREFIGSNLESIGDYAFSNTSSLTYLDTRKVTSIGNYAFDCSTGIQSIISDKITSIGEYSFQKSSVRNVELPCIRTVPSCAFENCKSLETVIIPNAIYIRSRAFYGCDSLKDVTFDSITHINSSGFENCTMLANADFPLLKYANASSFRNCTSLKNLNAPLLNEAGANAFENCTSIEKAHFQYMEKLSQNAYKGCTSLKTVNLPLLKTLEKNAFEGCSALNELWIKGDVTVEAGAFETDFTAEKVILDNAIEINDLPENIPTALPLSVTSIEDTDFDNVIIYGSKGSFGETWATENNQTFIEITTDTAIFQDVPQYCESTKETLSFDVMGLNRIYQWYGNTKNSNTGGKFIKNATTSEFTPANHTKIYDYYYCVVICQDGSNPIMTITSGVCTFIPIITSLLSTTTVDLLNLSIKTSVTETKKITDLIKISDNAVHYALPSFSNGKEDFFGTGSSVVVYLNGEPDSVFNLVVYGDLNGDSVCDALDCAELEKAANGHTTLNGNYFSAADMNINSKIDSRDYQNAVNKALAG